jgi:serine-type D-Ala-D-Ala carboxypeptidase (penicillin-binding protein 5/6)
LSGEKAVGGSDSALFGRISARLALAAVVVVVLSVFIGTALSRYSRAVPTLSPATMLAASFSAPSAPEGLPWPSVGQAAIAVDGFDGMVTHGTEPGAKPIASTAKVMTALVVLKHHPLQGSDPGPAIKITAADVSRYQEAIAQDQSAVEVRTGESITERELLEGLLIASANNFADILANWDSGTSVAFVQAMNSEAATLGMAHTHFADSSGFSPQTTSTATDLIALARAGMALPVFAEIVGKQSATVPVAGDVATTNSLLGQDGVIGIKTGETDEAGDCLIFAADLAVSGRSERVYGVVLGQPSRQAAFTAARTLLEAIPAQLTTVHVIARGQAAGIYEAPWAGTVEAVAAADLDVPAWAGTTLAATVSLQAVKSPIRVGTKVGTLVVSVGARPVSIDIVAAASIPAPGAWWKITR